MVSSVVLYAAPLQPDRCCLQLGHLLSAMGKAEAPTWLPAHGTAAEQSNSRNGPLDPIKIKSGSLKRPKQRFAICVRSFPPLSQLSEERSARSAGTIAPTGPSTANACLFRSCNTMLGPALLLLVLASSCVAGSCRPSGLLSPNVLQYGQRSQARTRYG